MLQDKKIKSSAQLQCKMSDVKYYKKIVFKN